MELLEEIAFRTHCMYISDLSIKQKELRSSIIYALDKIETNRYSIHEWNDAAKYLTGYSGNMNDEAAARNFIKFILSSGA